MMNVQSIILLVVVLLFAGIALYNYIHNNRRGGGCHGCRGQCGGCNGCS